MKLEIPELKRCCCCFPMRYGLITWAYIKLIFSLLFLGLITQTFYFVILRAQRMHVSIITFILIVFVILVILLDISLTIVFLIGGHKKNTKLMKVYYYYSMVTLCLYVLYFMVTTTIEFIFGFGFMHVTQDSSFIILYTKYKIIVGLANTGFQVYLMLLVRSEFRKIDNARKFRFMNPTQEEASCQMDADESNLQNNYSNYNGKTAENSEKVEDGKIIVEIEGNKVQICDKNINSDENDKNVNNYKYTPIKNIDM